jgi:hypothetical protein
VFVGAGEVEDLKLWRLCIPIFDPQNSNIPNFVCWDVRF